MAFSAAVPVLRVSVNVGNSLGSSGLQTNLAPSMTIGTGFFGRSSVGENLQPKHLINHTRIAYNADPREAMPAFAGLVPWSAPVGAVPMYPRASNEQQAHVDISAIRTPLETDVAQLREEIRRVIIEELQAMVKG
jgi:hypothetical protein